MSLPRIATRPFARVSVAPSRAFSSNRVVFQTSSPSNAELSSRRTDSNDFSSKEDQGQSTAEYTQTMAKKADTRERLANDTNFKTMANWMTRRGQWNLGDIYAPHDLTGAESSKWRRRGNATPATDAFDTLALDPLKEYKNFSIMSNYMSEYGRIKHRRVTGLRPKNQRRLAKAIRRSIGLGIMPSVHAHPESILNTSKVAVEDIRRY